MTNKCPTIPNRGYSRLQHLWLIERIIDVVAHELGFDPVRAAQAELRPARGLPVRDAQRVRVRLGRPAALARHRARDDRRRDVARASSASSATARASASASGSARRSTRAPTTSARRGSSTPSCRSPATARRAYAKLDLYGEVNVNLGTTPQGQGHETTAAQVVADILNMPPDQVQVTAGFNQQQNTYVAFSRHLRVAVRGHRAGRGQGRGREAARGDHRGRGVRAPGRRGARSSCADGIVLGARRRRARDPVHRHRQHDLLQQRGADAGDARRGSASTAATSTRRRSRSPTRRRSAAT